MAAVSGSPLGVKTTLLMARNVLLIISTEVLQMVAEARRHGDVYRKTLTACVLESCLPAVYSIAAFGLTRAVRSGMKSGRQRGNSLSLGLRLPPPS